jgi:hypothetical protein
MAPPRDLIRKKALHAAATVALAFSMGCLDKDEDDDGDVDGDSGDWTDVDSGIGAADESGGTTGSGGEDGAGTGGGEGGEDVGGGSAGTSGGSDDPPDCTQAEDMAACCDELADWCDDIYDPATQDYLDCLYGPGFDGSTGCIPWGPPVPPRMS